MIPFGVVLFNWIATLAGGAIRLRAPLLFAVGAAGLISIGLALELMQSLIPVAWQLADTASATAATGYVLVGGGVLGGLAALHYWYPKMTGRTMGETLAAISLALIVLGAHLTFIPMFIAGLEGQPVDIYKYYEGQGLDTLNLISTIGAFVLAAGIVASVVNALVSLESGATASDDPWRGETIEWFATSPPPEHNFDVIPDVRSAAAAARHPRRRGSQDRRPASPVGSLGRACSLSAMSNAPVGGTGELRRFRRLVEITILTTFGLIVLGGIVRVSDSGLGCGPSGSGTHGWPLCGGRALPFLEDNAIIEFTHRAVAGVVIVLIGLLAWRAYKGLRELRWPLRGTLLAGGLVLVQAGLGGLTVEKNLAEELVAAHLCLAMLLLGTLLWLDLTARRAEGSEPAVPKPRRGLRALAGIAAVVLLGAIVAGGYIAGTEKEGADGPVVVNGAHLACGEQFPLCTDRFLPFGETRLVDIHLTHRVLVYAATLAIAALLTMLLLSGVRSRLIAAAGGLLALQLLLGALNVWLGKHASLVVAHLTVGTLLWSTVLLIGMRYAWAGAPARNPTRDGGAEASTAPA